MFPETKFILVYSYVQSRVSGASHTSPVCTMYTFSWANPLWCDALCWLVSSCKPSSLFPHVVLFWCLHVTMFIHAGKDDETFLAMVLHVLLLLLIGIAHKLSLPPPPLTTIILLLLLLGRRNRWRGRCPQRQHELNRLVVAVAQQSYS